MHTFYDVIIVGCGPTGATLANYLGKSNLKVLIFDKETEIIPYPRAVHIDEEVIRVFQELELYKEMKEHAIKPFENYSLVNKKDKNLFSFQPKSSITENIADCNWIIQPQIEQYLRKGLERYPNVDFFSQVELLDFYQSKKQVTIEVFDYKNQKLNKINSGFLIGADGAKSSIRKELGIEMYDFGFQKKWFVIDAQYHGSENLSEDHKQFCNPKQPITYVNGVGNHFRWELMLDKKDENLSKQELAAKMISTLEQNTYFNKKDFTVIRQKKYTFHTLLAKRWRVERIFIAGDAAHQMPPFLGQGMCSGIKDAKNLAWKLSSVHDNYQNKNAQILLNSYQKERFTQVKSIIQLAAIMGGFIQSKNPFLTPVRNQILKTINILPSKPIDKLIEKHLYSIKTDAIQKKETLAGQRIPQPLVYTKSTQCYLDRVLQRNWCLLYRKNQKPKSRNNITVIELVETAPEQEQQIQSKKLSSWMDTHKIDAVIIRPDKFIFASAKKQNTQELLVKTNVYLEKISVF